VWFDFSATTPIDSGHISFRPRPSYRFSSPLSLAVVRGNDSFVSVKIPLLYGLGMAVGGAVLTLILYLAGFHDSVEAMKSSRWIGIVGGLTIGATGLSLAMRASRATQMLTAEQQWGYGQAVGTGVLAGLFSALFGFVFMFLYATVINSGFSDVLYQAQVEAMQAKGIPAEKIEAAEKTMRKFLSPLVLSLFQTVIGFVWSVLLSLVIAIFVKKRVDVA